MRILCLFSMVRRRCKYLRDTYVRAKRKRLNGEKRTPKEEYLLQKMQFLEPRRAETNSQLASENKPVFDIIFKFKSG